MQAQDHRYTVFDQEHPSAQQVTYWPGLLWDRCIPSVEYPAGPGEPDPNASNVDWYETILSGGLNSDCNSQLQGLHTPGVALAHRQQPMTVV